MSQTISFQQEKLEDCTLQSRASLSQTFSSKFGHQIRLILQTALQSTNPSTEFELNNEITILDMCDFAAGKSVPIERTSVSGSIIVISAFIIES